MLNHQTIWITGASSGIGLSVAKKLANPIYENILIISGRNEPALQSIKSINDKNVHILCFDIGNEDDVEAIPDQLAKLTGHIDTLILSAGIVEYIDTKESFYEKTKNVFNINVLGNIHCIEVALPFIKKAKGKKLIAPVCSLSSYIPFPRAEAYGASKAALQYFCEALRVDLHKQKIDVSIINPGFVKTPMTDKNDFDMPWLWESEQSADYILKNIDKYPWEIRFPWQLVSMLKFSQLLPSKIFNALSQFMVK